MKVGLAPFLNTAPFADLPFDIIYRPPSELNRLMRAGELDCALCSSIEYTESRYDRIGSFGLAARGAIKSVNLYIKGPIEGARICLDPKSGTSNALLQILCPNISIASHEEANGFILIGDDALRKPTVEGYKTIDLASLWYERTGLPFVFALFIKQKGLATEEMEAAISHLLSQFPKKIELVAKEERFPEKALREYFDLCHYRLGHEDEQGLKEFYDCYARFNQRVLF